MVNSTLLTASRSNPSVAEILSHPSYPSTIWRLEPSQEGKLPVAKARGGPINLSYEVHGTGDIKMVVSI